MAKELYTIYYSKGNHTSLMAWSFEYALILAKFDGLHNENIRIVSIENQHGAKYYVDKDFALKKL